MADEELKKAFHELQVKVIDTTQQVQITEAKIDQLKRNIAHAKLTDQELSSLRDETKTYESIGRVFLQQPTEVVRKAIGDRVQVANEKIDKLQLSKAFLEKSLKESEDNIREMIQQKRK